jgi:hypothetical protein
MKAQFYLTGGTVPVLGNDDIGFFTGVRQLVLALLLVRCVPLVFGLVILIAVDEKNDIGILLDGPAFAEVRKARDM